MSEKMLTYADHVGRFAEEMGPSGEQLGSFPQSFTHRSLITAVRTLDEALDGQRDRAASGPGPFGRASRITYPDPCHG